MPAAALDLYHSRSQLARVATETWAEQNLYCPCCNASSLNALSANTQAFDFNCPNCTSSFQLKAQSRPLREKVTDAGYGAMRRAVERGRTPNLLLLHYRPDEWDVANLLLIPNFAFSLSCIERRPPLGPNARRAGWVGCNIVIASIPLDARIAMVLDRRPVPPREVRRRYARLRPLSRISPPARGWTLDVLNLLRSRGLGEFNLDEAYQLAPALQHLHPSNRHVREKIRQQLQVLRDAGLVEFHERGHYRLL